MTQPHLKGVFGHLEQHLYHDVGDSSTVGSCAVRDVRSYGICALGHENNAKYHWRKSKGPGRHGRQDPCAS